MSVYFVDSASGKTELGLGNVIAYDDGLGDIQMSLGSLNLSEVLNYAEVVMNSVTDKLEDFGGVVGTGKFLSPSVAHNRMR